MDPNHMKVTVSVYTPLGVWVSRAILFLGVPLCPSLLDRANVIVESPGYQM